MRVARKFVKKLSFWMVVLIFFSTTMFWGVRIILQIDSKYSAAAAATRDIGIYAQRIASYANRIQVAKNAQVLEANQQMLRSLVRKMEIKHLSLMRGNPKMSSNDLFSNEIKAVYYAMPTNLVNQAREFLGHSKDLLAINFKELTVENESIIQLKSAANNGMISAVTHVIQIYETESEARISKSIFVLAAAVLAILILSVVAYLFIFDNPVEEKMTSFAPSESGSVSNVLGGLSVFPGKSEAKMEFKQKDNMSSTDTIIR